MVAQQTSAQCTNQRQSSRGAEPRGASAPRGSAPGRSLLTAKWLLQGLGQAHFGCEANISSSLSTTLNSLSESQGEGVFNQSREWEGGEGALR